MIASTSAMAKKSNDNIRIGEHAAMQPLSGVSEVVESKAVNGLGHGAYLRQEDSRQPKTK